MVAKKCPGALAVAACATGAENEAGSFGYQDTDDFKAPQSARQAARIGRWAHVSEPVARTLARLAYGSSGA